MAFIFSKSAIYSFEVGNEYLLEQLANQQENADFEKTILLLLESDLLYLATLL